METTNTTYAPAALHQMDLPVAMLDGAIRVGAGRVVLEGRAEDLPEETIAIPTRAFVASVFCYLVRDRTSGALALFVDEHVQDGVSAPYVFDRDAGPYRLIAYLFHVVVPAGSNDLRGLPFTRWRIVPTEE